MTLGAGGMLQAGAVGNDSSSPSLFVATTPCRLLDTRDAPETVGPRARPLEANDTFTTSVIGTTGCALPTDATTLVMNVTATDQTASSFLTVYGDGTRPLASSLNWDITSGDTANAVTANVSANGELSFYNLAGTTNIVADVVGYYTSTAFEDFYNKADVDAMIADEPGRWPVPSVPLTPTARPDRSVRHNGLTAPTGPIGANGLDGPMEPTARPAQRPRRRHRPNGTAGSQPDLDGLDGATGPMGPRVLGHEASGQGPQARTGRRYGRFGSCRSFLRHDAGRQQRLPSPSVERSTSRNDGPNTSITASTASRNADADEFVLAQAGVYRVSVQVSVTEAAQIVLDLNGTPFSLTTTVGRGNGHQPDHDGHTHHPARADILSVENSGAERVHTSRPTPTGVGRRRRRCPRARESDQCRYAGRHRRWGPH